MRHRRRAVEPPTARDRHRVRLSIVAAVNPRPSATGEVAQGEFMSTSTIIILAVIVVIVVWAIGVYNSLISMQQRVNQAFADVDVQLRQRHDLIPNLVETVKGYAAHESGVFEKVTEARASAMRATTVTEKGAAENMLSGALRQ